MTDDSPAANAATEESSTSAWITKSLEQNPPPNPLIPGWILRQSRSLPGNYYYYHQETGYTQWDEPVARDALADESKVAAEDSTVIGKDSDATKTKRSTKRSGNDAPADEPEVETQHPPPSKRAKTDLKEVRVLHLLKKHKGSRRPASWRNPKILCSIEEAAAELEEFLSILKESQSEEEMRATFEELARTESDCSSAKRGGDLGFFGRRKMQPAFEKAAFALQIGQLSDVVETSSGVHILLRIG